MKKIIITEKQLGKLVSEQTYVLGCEGFEMLDPSFQNTLCAQCEDPTYTNMHCDCCPSYNTVESPINTETEGDIDPSNYFDASMPGMNHPVRPQRKMKPKPRKRNR